MTTAEKADPGGRPATRILRSRRTGATDLPWGTPRLGKAIHTVPGRMSEDNDDRAGTKKFHVDGNRLCCTLWFYRKLGVDGLRQLVTEAWDDGGDWHF
jgi:hypothetical protein